MQQLSRLNKAGLVLAGVLGIVDVGSLAFPTPDGQVGPPYWILVLDSVLGVITLVGVAWALLRQHRGAVRIVAAARVVSLITALPAFFVGPPAGLLLLVGAFAVITVVVVAMILTPPRRSMTVSD
jgi:hypothetical protein